MQLQNPLLDCVFNDKLHNPSNEQTNITSLKGLTDCNNNQRKIRNCKSPDWFVLSYTIDSFLSLLLHSRIPPWIHQENLAEKALIESCGISYLYTVSKSQTETHVRTRQESSSPYIWCHCKIEGNTTGSQVYKEYSAIRILIKSCDSSISSS